MARVRPGPGFVLGEIALTCAVLLLAFVGWKVWFSDVQANAVQGAVAEDLLQDWGREPADTSEAVTIGEVIRTDIPVLDPEGTFALLRVPRWGQDYSVPIAQGVSQQILREVGIGHYPGTAAPGESGNVGLAAHRTSHGARFGEIEALVNGDPLVIEGAEGYWVYRVRDHAVVDPGDSWVLDADPTPAVTDDGDHVLTLTTCHPRFSQAQRYVVWADLDYYTPKASGIAPDLAAGEPLEAQH